jgi:hypothetical protein
MKWIISTVFLGSLVTGAFTYISYPDLIHQMANETVAQVDRIIAKLEAPAIEKARKRAFREWKAHYGPTPDCAKPGNTTQQRECKSLEDQSKQAFARHWQQKLDSGWRPG